MPHYGVIFGLTRENSWPVETAGGVLRMAYIATDSTERLSFATVQTAARPEQVARVASRPTHYADMRAGVVIELHLTEDLREEEQVEVLLAQAGATTYFPPQQIDDSPED